MRYRSNGEQQPESPYILPYPSYLSPVARREGYISCKMRGALTTWVLFSMIHGSIVIVLRLNHSSTDRLDHGRVWSNIGHGEACPFAKRGACMHLEVSVLPHNCKPASDSSTRRTWTPYLASCSCASYKVDAMEFFLVGLARAETTDFNHSFDRQEEKMYNVGGWTWARRDLRLSTTSPWIAPLCLQRHATASGIDSLLGKQSRATVYYYR